LSLHMELLTFVSAWWMQKFTPSINFPSDCTTTQHVGYHNTSYPGAQLCRCNFFTVFNWTLQIIISSLHSIESSMNEWTSSLHILTSSVMC
jgi:hypothetical protein